MFLNFGHFLSSCSYEKGTYKKVCTITINHAFRFAEFPFFTRPRMGPSLGFVTDVFFCRRGVETIMVCSRLHNMRFFLDKI